MRWFSKILRLTFVVTFAGVGGLTSEAMAADRQSGRPVVVELFTSQGCSSCPPADAYLGELARRDDVIALAYHVDYWDYIGWKDPFAVAEHTSRQRAYARAMGLRTIYTPQMLLDGRVDAVGSRRSDVEAKIATVARLGPGERVDVPVVLSVDAEGVLSIEVPAGSAGGASDVWLVAYDDMHVTPVPRGENQGRTLTDFNVVRALWRVGEWTGTALSERFDTTKWPIKADRVALLVQRKDAGPIVGAAGIPLKR